MRSDFLHHYQARSAVCSSWDWVNDRVLYELFITKNKDFLFVGSDIINKTQKNENHFKTGPLISLSWVEHYGKNICGCLQVKSTIKTQVNHKSVDFARLDSNFSKRCFLLIGSLLFEYLFDTWMSDCSFKTSSVERSPFRIRAYYTPASRYNSMYVRVYEWKYKNYLGIVL